MNFDIKIKTLFAENIFAKQPGFTTVLQYLFKWFAQVAIFTTLIEQAFSGAYNTGADCHAFENLVCVGIQQHAVFKCARFTFVSIAYHVTQVGCCLFAETPFQPGSETGAATTA